MGKYINHQVVNEMDSLVTGFKKRLDNPFYNWSNYKGTVVTYYNVDIDNTTLDPGSEISYSYAHHQSFKYNKIHNFIIYGIERVLLTLEDGEFGVEATDIAGEALILPNTIKPYPGDHFLINHIKEELLFRVTEVHPDTLNNGSNMYKIGYKIISSDKEKIEDDISDEYNFLLDNTGTTFNPVILKSEYDALSVLDETITKLKSFYIDLFYSDRVQSFIFCNRNKRFYDTYMTQFFIDSRIFSSKDKYIHIQHQLPLPKIFSIKYSKTFFNAVLERDINKAKRSCSSCYGIGIDRATSIFNTRYEEYCYMEYDTLDGLNPRFMNDLIYNPFDADFIDKITNNIPSDDIITTVISKYFNHENITNNDINKIETMELLENSELFYRLPIVIYCLEQYAESLIKKRNDDNDKNI